MKSTYILRTITIIASLVIIALLMFWALMSTAFLERTVANSVPKYPSATSWKISGSTNLYGQKHADIYFYSKDTPEKVLSYYITELPKKDIEFIDQGKLYDLKGETGDFWANFEKGKYSIHFTSRYNNPLKYGPLKNANYTFSILYYSLKF